MKLPASAAFLALAAQLFAPLLCAQGPANVLVVINDKSSLCRNIGEYYALRREIPAKNLCHLRTTEEEVMERPIYNREIAAPIAGCLRQNGLTEQILYIVTTAGVPLKIAGSPGLGGDLAAVDSELTLLYSDMHQGRPHSLNGMVPNPFFGKRDAKFTHPEFPIYLVTRLAAYDFDGVKAIVDRAREAVNRGKFVIDTKSAFEITGDDWLRNAAILLPKERVVFDSSSTVLYGQTDVIGYASWGSNDTNRHRRFLGFKWLPGAIATEFVSSDARTFSKPPDDWELSDWGSPKLWFAGSPQTMTADFLLEGATGASGHVYEPYLNLTPRPQFVLPAYYQGRNLAESFYLGIPGLSWQNVVIGDPLCSLGPPSK
ncbi:MAG TPA: TIGR03790 family protein [Bryobacteraceae bacterium]|nr:TIGR03790 family protein [Bryobacteraceae bacterium]